MDECSTDLDSMLYVLKNSGNLKKRSGWLLNKIYTKILEACEIARFSKEKRIQYNKDMKDERRREGEIQAAGYACIKDDKKMLQKSLQGNIKLLLLNRNN
jgi:hypothetical protein